MPVPRIFVSHDPSSERGSIVANQLAKHLQNEGFDTLTSQQTNLNAMVGSRPSSDQWVVLVRTTQTETENSKPYQEASNALNLYMQGQLQGVIAVAWTPNESEELAYIPPLLSTIATYNIGSTQEDQDDAFDNVTKTIGYTAKQSVSTSTPNTQNPLTGQNSISSWRPNGATPSASRGTPLPLLVMLVLATIVIILASVIIYGITVTMHPGNGKRATALTSTHASSHAPTVSPSTPSASATLTPQQVQEQAQALYNSSIKGITEVNLVQGVQSDGIDWAILSNECVFQGEFYTITTTTFQTCMAENSNFKDFVYEVKMSITTGVAGGLIFRSGTLSGNSYRFSLKNTGAYTLFLCNTCMKSDASDAKILISGNAPVSPLPNGASTALTVIARGSSIYLYINKTYVTQVQNPSFSAGQIGLYAATAGGPSTTVQFSDLKVVTLR